MPPVVRAQLDYYAVLEITPSANTVEVNAAFRRLAWRYHPDRNPTPGATLQFQDINEAHQVLSDPVRRTEYDAKWHPRSGNHRRATRPAVRPRIYRSTRHRRHVRTLLLTLFAFLFVTSAWAVIFTAMTAAHSAGGSFAYEASSAAGAGASANCGYSMEIFPVTYTDEHGRLTTAWQTDVRNCWGGSILVSGAPLPAARAARFVNGPTVR